MAVHQEHLVVRTSQRGLTEITQKVQEVVRESGIKRGLCTVFIQHTSASLFIQENADPAVGRDLVNWLADMAPESRPWEHDDEGPDDMPAHAKSVVTRTSETMIVTDGRLALGTWQGLFVCEHRSRGHERRLLIHISGETT